VGLLPIFGQFNPNLPISLTVTYNNTCFWPYDVFTTVLVHPGAELLNATTSAQNLQGPLTTRGASFTALSASVRVPALSRFAQ
jgi:hypothetical protein